MQRGRRDRFAATAYPRGLPLHVRLPGKSHGQKERTTKSFAQALQATATVALSTSIVLLASNLVWLPRVPLPKVIQ